MGLMWIPRKSLPGHDRKAFTLTELLVVIGVISILLAIVLTVLHGAYKAVRALKG